MFLVSQLRKGSPPPMRGKAIFQCSHLFALLGSPPPMRGKAGLGTDGQNGTGITPAYAGKSCTLQPSFGRSGDHPRLCREKFWKSCFYTNSVGSPPPMRGKDSGCRLKRRSAGITPAYAGKRLVFTTVFGGVKDHPRLCGEKPRLRRRSRGGVGSPMSLT